MIRLFPAFLAFFVLTLVAVTASQAAEPSVDFVTFAQVPNMQRGPGMYLNLFKFVPVVIIYLLWAWTTNWVEDDTKELNNVRFAVWNSAVFFSGVLGLALVLALPIYFIGLGLLLLAYFVPLLSYIYARNQTVPDDQKVLTPYHIGEVCNDILHKLGMKAMFNKDVGTVDREGPPIVFVGKSQGSAKEDPTRVRQAEESRSYMAAKELVYDAVLRRSTDIHLEPTTEQISVRYRIDGILHAAEPFDLSDRRRRGERLQGALGDGHLRELQAAGRLIRRDLARPRTRLPRRDIGVESGREAGHANSRQQLVRDQDGRPGHAAQVDRAGAGPGDSASRPFPLLRPDRCR